MTAALSPQERALIAKVVADGMVRRVGPRTPPPVVSDARGDADAAARWSGVSLAPAPRRVRQMGIRQALEWAFGVEMARLRFNDSGAPQAPAFGMEFVLMERAMLGQEVDTSRGRSSPADDAELIADAVQSQLRPAEALWVAELARSMRSPDPLVGVVPKCVPVAWSRATRHGAAMGKAEVVETIRYHGRRGWVERQVRATPVRFVPDAAEIAAARRTWLDWWGHMVTLSAFLRAVDLRWVEITDRMPPMRPWAVQEFGQRQRNKAN